MISVIIGVYNYKHFTNLYSVLDSITNQKNVKEIIISDNSKTETANIKKICKRFGVKYIFAKISPTGGNIGLSRNMAAKMAKGKFLYFTDADVILYDKRYFIKLLNIINKNQKYILMQPSMYRVKRGKEKLKSDFIQYKTKINFNFDGGCFYNYKNLNFIPVKEKEKIIKGEECVCTLRELKKVQGKNIEKMEELIWRPNFHWGVFYAEKSNSKRLADIRLVITIGVVKTLI